MINCPAVKATEISTNIAAAHREEERNSLVGEVFSVLSESPNMIQRNLQMEGNTPVDENNSMAMENIFTPRCAVAKATRFLATKS